MSYVSRPARAALQAVLLIALSTRVSGQGAGGRGAGGAGIGGGGISSYGSQHYGSRRDDWEEDGEKFGNWELLFCGLIVGGACCFVAHDRYSSWQQGGERASRQEAFVGRAPDTRSAYGTTGDSPDRIKLPSGSWRGYYNQYGQRWNVSTFDLNFDMTKGEVVGHGTDVIGGYDVSGMVSGDGKKVAFSKKYIAGSRADDGYVNHEQNFGHVVEYRGEIAGTRLGQGFKGKWYIDIPGQYTGSGAFHIWPAMEGWLDGERQITGFKVSSDNICVVCFSNPINACMVPCGHIAACAECIRRIRNPRQAGAESQGCPICRSPIDGFIDPDGVTVSDSRTS
eukprot:TRINITY_DN55830_c0_g1_i1.p1 TRINITY_DN55830_c0_g1~~TRINITY_DN55830_c0_g1_i1.p1  ORF type:complete len:338 (-),score=30.55 TRINITY_DN55830_c0_g1_i1:177-1190(-)